MKARLLALAAFLATAGAGIYFFNLNTGAPFSLPSSFGVFEIVDRNQCTVSACGAPACDNALALLLDGGVSDATIKFVECPFRIGPRVRNLAADAGVIFSSTQYQMVKLIVMNRPTAGGGIATGIPVDDNGWPSFAVAHGTYPCAWKAAPTDDCTLIDGGVIDERSSDGGWDPNTKLPGQFAGTNCTRKTCVEIAGDPSTP